jgi:hypothetical protein
VGAAGEGDGVGEVDGPGEGGDVAGGRPPLGAGAAARLAAMAIAHASDAWTIRCVRGRSGRSGIIRDPRIQTFRRGSIMAERSRTRRNTLERRCLGKGWKRMFVGSPKSIFKMLEAIKKI